MYTFKCIYAVVYNKFKCSIYAVVYIKLYMFKCSIYILYMRLCICSFYDVVYMYVQMYAVACAQMHADCSYLLCKN